MPFIFYDTETSGKRLGFDQILQFAAILTDDDLEILDTFDIRSALLPHIIPSPEALLVTGVSIAQLRGTPLSHFEMMRQIRSKMNGWCGNGGVFIGWNSLRFDEVMLRQAYYQSLLPVYQTNTNGNGRADMMRMAQTAAACTPGVITVPVGEKQKRSFRLGDIAAANGIDLDNAHDALADTHATLEIARLVKERAPALWDVMIANAKKSAPLQLIKGNRALLLTETYGGIPYNLVVAPITPNFNNANEWGLLDLQFDPNTLLDGDDDALRSAIDGKVKAIRRVSINAQPCLLPIEFTPENVRGGRLPLETYHARAQQIIEHHEFQQRVARVLAARYADQEQSPHVEQRIYDGFPLYPDENRMAAFHKCEWPLRSNIVASFDDDRFRELGERIVATHRPDLLSEAERQRWCAWRRDRLLNDDVVPWLTVPAAHAEIAALTENASPEERRQLTEMERFLMEVIVEHRTPAPGTALTCKDDRSVQ